MAQVVVQIDSVKGTSETYRVAVGCTLVSLLTAEGQPRLGAALKAGVALGFADKDAALALKSANGPPIRRRGGDN